MTLVVFDCDGTLVDSAAVIVGCARRAFARLGLKPPEPEAIRHIVGLSLAPAMRTLLGRDDPVLVERIAEAYRADFVRVRALPGHDEPLFPGVVDLLDTLDTRGVLAGVATGKSMRGLEAVLTRHGLKDRFVTLQTADLHPSKPHPDMLLAAMAEAGAAPHDTLIVGDTTFDVEMGVAAGCTPVGVAWGNHPAATLRAAGAVRVLERFDDLLELLP